MNLTARRARWRELRERRAYDGVRMRNNYDWWVWAIWPVSVVGVLLMTLCYIYPQSPVHEIRAATPLQWAVFAWFVVGFSLAFRLYSTFKLTCPHCRKKLSSAMPWRCGQCQYDHTENIGHGFLRRCRNRACKERPSAIQCLHCQGTIPLEVLPDPSTVPAYRREAGPAILFTPPPKPPDPPGVLIRAKFSERYWTAQGTFLFAIFSLIVAVGMTVIVNWKVREDYKDIVFWAEKKWDAADKKQWPDIGQFEKRVVAKGYTTYWANHPWRVNTLLAATLAYLFGIPGLMAALTFKIWYTAKPLEFRCPHCKAYMPSNMGWTCQSCGKTHADGQFAHSYLRKCTCKFVPPDMKCKRCGNAVVLIEGAAVPAPKPVATPASAIPATNINPPPDPYDIYKVPEPEPEPVPQPEPDLVPAGIYLGEVFESKPPLWYAVKRKSKHVVIPDFPDTRRFEHCYMRAASGGGKTNTLKHIIAQDLQDPTKGVIVLGPEPELFQDLLPYVPRNRADDLVYFNPMDETEPILGFNPFTFNDTSESPEERRKALLYRSGEATTIVKRALGDLGVTMTTVVSAIARALVLLPDATISDIPRLLDPENDRLRLHIASLGDVPNDLGRFWATYDQNTAYKRVHENVLNRFSDILQPPVSTVLSVNSFRWNELIQSPKIVFVDLGHLPKGEMLTTVAQITLASIQTAFRRTEHIPEVQRIPYFLFMDEFQDFLAADDSLDEMFRQARKQRCGITIAHQTTDKIPKSLLGVITGNVGSMIILHLNDPAEAADMARTMQLHTWDGNLQTVEQIRQGIIDQHEEYEQWKRRHNAEFHSGRPPVFKPSSLTEAEIEQSAHQIIDHHKDKIDPTILMNLDNRQGQSVARIAGENYGITTKIPLFKKRTGEKVERYVEWLKANAKKKYGVKKSVEHRGENAEEDEDYLS